jgi:hypothetical protein
MESFFASLKKELALVAGVRLPGGVRTDGIKLNPVSTFRGELQSTSRGEVHAPQGSYLSWRRSRKLILPREFFLLL